MLIYGSQEGGYPEAINFFHYVPVNWNANPKLREEYKQLITVYNEHPALRSSGTIRAFDDDENNILCIERVLNNDNVLVLVNVRDKEQNIEVPKMWADRPATDLMTGNEINLGAKITMRPYQYLLLSNK